MSEGVKEPNVADLLARLTDAQDFEYAERIVDGYEEIERVYALSLPPAVPVGLSASANPRV
jgi:hypothetical protein